MNYKEYKEAEKNHVKGIHYWANKVRKIQKSLEFNPDSTATVRHHLRDTEEQRKYNNEHYEMFGFEIDENGKEVFVYGKYIVFVTEEQHHEIHKVSDETRLNISEANKNRSDEVLHKIGEASRKRWQDPDYIEKMKRRSENRTYEKHTDETKNKISVTQKANMTPEHRKKISEATKRGMDNAEVRQKIIAANTGENNPNYGRPRPDSTKDKISNSKKEYMKKLSELFKRYKQSGGELQWRQFQTYARDNHLL